MEKKAAEREEGRQPKEGGAGQRPTKKDGEQDGDAGKTWDRQHDREGGKKNRDRKLDRQRWRKTKK